MQQHEQEQRLDGCMRDDGDPAPSAGVIDDLVSGAGLDEFLIQFERHQQQEQQFPEGE